MINRLLSLVHIRYYGCDHGKKCTFSPTSAGSVIIFCNACKPNVCINQQQKKLFIADVAKWIAIIVKYTMICLCTAPTNEK